MKPSPTPFPLGPAHLVGIGGIGMSGIAEIMMNLGYQVQGSDMKDSANVKRLREKGAVVHIGHVAENVAGTSAVIISSAIKDDNIEVQAARAAGIQGPGSQHACPRPSSRSRARSFPSCRHLRDVPADSPGRDRTVPPTGWPAGVRR